MLYYKQKQHLQNQYDRAIERLNQKRKKQLALIEFEFQCEMTELYTSKLKQEIELKNFYKVELGLNKVCDDTGELQRLMDETVMNQSIPPSLKRPETELECKERMELQKIELPRKELVDRAMMQGQKIELGMKSKVVGAVETKILGSEKKLYECEECGKTFKLVETLKVHQNIHLQRFKCEFCGKCFASRGNLANHERIHSGEKPFQCNVCFKKFSRKGSLQVHNQIHNNVRFECKYCKKSFSSNSNLTHHVKEVCKYVNLNSGYF